MDWYEKSFGKYYSIIYTHRNDSLAVKEVNSLEKILSLKKNHKILDLCCGDGRHAVELAKRGYKVVGFDLSDYLLSLAKEKAGSIEIQLVKGDMRNLPFIDEFDVVLNLFTSFGYFNTDGENKKVIKQIKKVLKQDGVFLIDYLNKCNVINNLISKSTKRVKSTDITEERWISNEMVHKKITVAKEEKNSVFYERVKLYTFDKMKEFIIEAGLKINNVFGDYDMKPYKKNSRRMIIVGRNK